MAENDDLDEELDEESDGEEEHESSGGGGKKKLFIVIGLALLLVIGGAAAAYFTGLLQPVIDMISGGQHKQEADVSIAQDAIFYDLPEMLVNLNTAGRKSTFLKIKVSLELDSPEDVAKIEKVMPRIIDNFQVYLRELRVEDLKGSAGMYRLREELLKRVGAAVAPSKINDVLFKEMLVQ